jgi:hypothetical protein
MASATPLDESIQRTDVFVFYFDVAGCVDQFLTRGDATLSRLRRFQRAARHDFEFGRENSYVATLFDNVWARINATEPGLPSLLLNFAGRVMDAAQSEGFDSFFGCITRGTHDFDPSDRMLVGGDRFEDLREQHLDMTSEPHIRAAYAERWQRVPTLPDNCVWVSAEAVPPRSLEAEASFPDSAFRPFREEFDLKHHTLATGKQWPFSHSLFRGIRYQREA